MEVRFIFLHPPILEEILFATPIIRAVVKSVEHAEVISAVPPQFRWVIENNPYISSILPYEKAPSKHIGEFRDLNADYLVDLTGGKNIRWFKNRLRVMDFTFPYKIIKEYQSAENQADALGVYRKAGIDLLGLFDLEDDKDGMDYYYGHNKPFVAKALPESFINKYAVLDLPDSKEDEAELIEKVSKLISMIERPIVLCGSEQWRKAGEEVMRNTGCTILSTCGDFNDQEQVFLRAEASVLLNIQKRKEIWSMVFDKPHFYIDLDKSHSLWINEVDSIRKHLRKE